MAAQAPTASPTYARFDIFDFDSTLVYTGIPNEMIARFQQLTGHSWFVRTAEEAVAQGRPPEFRREAWWWEPDSLRPPLIPEPCPRDFRNDYMAAEFVRAESDAAILTLVLTSRATCLHGDVLRILAQLGLLRDGNRLFCNPGMPTLEFKTGVISAHVGKFGCPKMIVVWEDRPELAAEYFEWLTAFQQANPALAAFEVHLVAGYHPDGLLVTADLFQRIRSAPGGPKNFVMPQRAAPLPSPPDVPLAPDAKPVNIRA